MVPNDVVTMNLLETRATRDRGARVFVEWTPVPRKIELLVNVKFLVAKEYDTPLRNKKSSENRRHPW